MNHKQIGTFISKLRKEKGLTQQQLGQKLYITDKAISKWERGLSLPDITLLNQLAQELDVTVTELLNGEKGNHNTDIEIAIAEATNQIKQNQKKRRLKYLIIIPIIIVLLLYLLFRNLYLGYHITTVNYPHTVTGEKIIKLGIPQLSFMRKQNDRSYSFKNLRNANILESEIKKYLKTLEYLNCNDTIYYYDPKNDFTIINYNVKNNILFSTISYEIANDNYCHTNKMIEYSDKIVLAKMFTNRNNTEKGFYISFIDGMPNSKGQFDFIGQLTIRYFDREKGIDEIYEKSEGMFEIKNDKLIYTRHTISEKNNHLKIPTSSTFTIQDNFLRLDDNYLSNYLEEVILQ